ncbi:MAG: zinc-binding dehydrogenase, partial [Xanthobacteraceae bacterium]
FGRDPADHLVEGAAQHAVVDQIGHVIEQPVLVDILAPQGKIGLIDDPATLNVMLLKAKAASLHWEAMFTRSSFQTADMIAQHRLLNDVANLIDNGVLRSTLDKVVGRITAENLKAAHSAIESGRTTGKLVLEGWT